VDITEMKIFVLMSTVFFAMPALASPADDMFNAGQFGQAATLARQDCDSKINLLNTIEATDRAIAAVKRQAADSCAMAARATLVVAAYQTSSRPQAEKLIGAAIASVNTALAQTPNHIEATLQGAVALGYSAKLAQSPGIAKDAKVYMDKAEQLAPNNGFAALALAGWNGEAIADIGSFLAGTVLGAKKETAIKYYERALKLDSASPTFPIFYAFNLYRLDAKKYSPRVAQLLSTAIMLTPRDGFEAMNITHAREVLTMLKAGDAKRTKALIKKYQPFGVLLKK
jgi:tetratricopeptide (TPR) repeat protein